MRRPTLLVLLCALLLCACLPAAAAAATRVVRYTPFTADGEIKPSLNVTGTANGDCWIGGINGRADAWRCLRGNLILDPCFESPIADLAVCPRNSPASGRVTVLRDPDFDRDAANRARRGRVWAIRVAGGRTCVAAGGTHPVQRGRAVSLFCDRNTAVWGALDRRRPTWRALVGGYGRSARWTWRRVATAWR